MAQRPIPALLYPPELHQAQACLRSQRSQVWAFWLLVWPVSLSLGIGLSELLSAGFFSGLGLIALSFVGLLFARRWQVRRQHLARQDARRLLSRWRRLPVDPRWDAAMVLLQRIASLSDERSDLRGTTKRIVAVLFALYEDIVRLDKTIVADRILDGDGELSERYYRLVAVQRRREAQITELINGLRDLHVEINEQLAENLGPLQLRLQGLLDQLEADREVARLTGIKQSLIS